MMLLQAPCSFFADFHKLGGYNFILQLLASEHPGLRWRSASLLATLVQNNPYCQSVAVQHKMMPMLLRTVDTDVNETVRIKALYAVSCECEHWVLSRNASWETPEMTQSILPLSPIDAYHELQTMIILCLVQIG